MTHHPEISVIVPVMNEAGNIAPLIHAIDVAFSKRSIEIIYVNDASTDSTLDELKAEKAKRKHLRVINHSKRSGQSAALRTGILSAKPTVWQRWMVMDKTRLLIWLIWNRHGKKQNSII